MAKYYVQCQTCGTEIRVDLVGKVKDREWKLDNFTWICDECKEKDRQEKNAIAAADAKAKGLPELEGSEKQVAWANTLRQKRLKELENFQYPSIFTTPEKTEATNKSIQALRVVFETETKASCFINTRDYSLTLLVHEIEPEAIPKKEEIIKEHKQADEAKAEAILSPSEPVTATIAEITETKTEITISFPERNEDFRELVKGLGYTWKETKWSKTITASTGTAEDRGAELGCLLLAAGFRIMVFNETIREKILKKDFTEEHRLWIVTLSGEKNTRRLGLKFPYGSGLFEKARKITGSRYSKPFVSVPVEHFEQVLDFAEQHGFKITDSAQKMIDEQIELVKKMTIADLGPVQKSEIVKIESTEIDKDLLDEDV